MSTNAINISIKENENLVTKIISSISKEIKTKDLTYDLIIPVLYHNEFDFTKRFKESVNEYNLIDENNNKYIIHDDFLEDGRNLSEKERIKIINTYKRFYIEIGNNGTRTFGCAIYLKKHKEDNK